jgi:pimeloyl-ACP methyl ester carboxylesterase
MKPLFLLPVLCFGLFSANAQADWLKDAINKTKQTINGWLSATEQPLPALQSAELEDYPTHYGFYREIEPLFNSPLFYLQTGLKSKPPILLIHGLGDAASKDWLNVIPELEKDYQVFALDLPGFGLSKGQYFEYSPHNYSLIIDWFIATKIQDKPILIGHSMGAAISLYYAANFSTNIEQLVLVDAAGVLERTSFIKHLAELPETTVEGPVIWSRVQSEISNFSSKWVEKTGEFYDPTKLLQQNHALRQVMLAEKPTMNAALAMIDTDYSILNYTNIPPTTLIWGEIDPIAPLRTGQALMAKLPSAELKIIRDAGHVPMNSHTSQFNQILKSSLEKSIDDNQKELKSSLAVNESPVVKPERIARCKDDDTPLFEGNYHSISLINCKFAVLKNVQVINFSSKDSIVTIASSQIGNLSSIIQLDSSSITATASKFFGKIVTNRTRLDLAAVSLYSNEDILVAKDTTKLVFSISDAQSKYYQGSLHGYFSMSEGTLDKQLLSK